MPIVGKEKFKINDSSSYLKKLEDVHIYSEVRRKKLMKIKEETSETVN